MIDLLRSIAIYLATFRPYNVKLFLTFPLMCLGPISLAVKGRVLTTELLTNVGLAVIGLFCILIATFMVNDVTDAQIDEVAHPERPIPSGKVPARHIMYAAFVFYLIAYVTALLINQWVLLITMFISAISLIHFGYTKRRLRIPGSSEIITPLTWASMPAYCFLAVDNYDPLRIFLLAIFIYFADVAHDTLGGACDLAGDQRDNVTTFASVFGRKRAVSLSLLMFIVSTVAGISLYFFTPLGYVYLIALGAVSFYVVSAYLPTLKYSRAPSFMTYAVRNHSLIGNYFVAGFSLLFIDDLAMRGFERFIAS